MSRLEGRGGNAWERVHTTPEIEPIAKVGGICVALVMDFLGFRETQFKRAIANGRAMKQCVIQWHWMLGLMYHYKFICRIWKCKSFPFKTKKSTPDSPSTYLFIYFSSFQIIPSQTSQICHFFPWLASPAWIVPSDAPTKIVLAKVMDYFPVVNSNGHFPVSLYCDD